MQKWRELVDAVNRTVIPHDVEFYQRQERKRHDRLLDDERKGLAVAAENAGEDGKILCGILEQLLQHPLCKNITQKPRLYIHHSLESQLATFSNIIIVPNYEIVDITSREKSKLDMLKSCIAHELAHIINGDAQPAQRVHNSHSSGSQLMERRADSPPHIYAATVGNRLRIISRLSYRLRIS